MPFIKRHVTRRLKSAKQECDKDLQRVTNAITVFFEERLREGDVDRESLANISFSVSFPLSRPHLPFVFSLSNYF
jgi:serine/threonine-protein kinase RIM15